MNSLILSWDSIVRVVSCPFEKIKDNEKNIVCWSCRKECRLATNDMWLFHVLKIYPSSKNVCKLHMTFFARTHKVGEGENTHTLANHSDKDD